MQLSLRNHSLRPLPRHPKDHLRQVEVVNNLIAGPIFIYFGKWAPDDRVKTDSLQNRLLYSSIEHYVLDFFSDWIPVVKMTTPSPL